MIVRKLALRVVLIASAATLIALAIFPPSRHQGGPAQTLSTRTGQGAAGAPEGRTHRAKPSPERLARVFLPPRATNHTQAAVISAQPPEEKILPALQSVGVIKDEAGIERLYLKDSSNGQVIRVRVDGVDEEGNLLINAPDGPFVMRNGTRYRVQGAKP